MKSKSSSDDLDENESIGIGVGVVMFVVLIATVGLCAFLKRRKKKSQENTAKSGSQLDQPPAEGAVEGEPVSASGGSKVAVAKSPSRSASKASAVPPNSPGGGSGS